MKRLLKKASTWIRLDNEYLNEGPEGYDNPNADTCVQVGILPLDFVKGLPGYNGENRQWEDWTNPNTGEQWRFFGNYREDKWNRLLEDIKQNGIQNPIQIDVDVNGNMSIYEGNHRIAACEQLGITEIPAKVYYRGNSQRQYKIT